MTFNKALALAVAVFVVIAVAVPLIIYVANWLIDTGLWHVAAAIFFIFIMAVAIHGEANERLSYKNPSKELQDAYDEWEKKNEQT